MQYDFDAWAKDKDLSKEKGWKWYKRWEEQAKKYTNANGSLIGELEYFKEATQVAAIKELQIREGRAAASWIPVGPFVTPGSVGRINTIAFHPTNPNIFWVGVAQGGVWKTTGGYSHHSHSRFSTKFKIHLYYETSRWLDHEKCKSIYNF